MVILMTTKKKRKYHKGITVREAAFPESYDEYLECIYRLEQLHPGQDVKNKEISEELRVKAPSVSHMLQQLTLAGLIIWKPHGEIQLTEKGVTRARDMIEYHDLTVNFLKKILKMTDMEAIEKIACDFEHHFTPELKNHMIELIEKGE